MSIGIWTNQGVVVTPVSADAPGQPNVLYEANPLILSANPDGKIFKMWFGSVNGVCYAESNNGTAWTRYSSNPIIVISGTKSPGWNAYPRIFKNGSTYYAYVVNANAESMSSWTSTDGVTWSEQNANALTGWGVGSAFVGQLSVLGQSAGTWYGYYTGYESGPGTYAIGYATSTDLLTWVGYSGNPVITAGQPSNFTFQQVGNTYYGWSQIVQAGIPAYGSESIPSDISRYESTSLTGPWTGPLPASTLYRTTLASGVGITVGQVADPCIINVSGTTYMYATVTPTGNSSNTGYQIACYTTSLSIAQLVQTYEGVFDIPQPSSYGFANQLYQLAADSGFTSGNWTTLTTTSGWGAPTFGAGFAQGTTADVRGSARYSGGSISWPNDQWASVTLKTNANAGSYTSAMVRGSTSGAATGYLVTIGGAALGSGSVALYIQKFVNNTYTLLYQAVGGTFDSWAVGDVLTISVVGTTISIYQNGNLITTVTDSAIASGAPGFSCYGDVSAADSAISAFAAGGFSTTIGGSAGTGGATVSYTGTASGTATADVAGNYIISGLPNGSYTITPSLAGYTFSPTSASETVSGYITDVDFTASAASGAYSVPDCRVTKPNSATGETINGTILYDSQTSSNPAIPPTDSRVSKPVACGTYPQNSRTPGTYGPGE